MISIKHLGDITKIKGNEAPVVDCIVGGSPCQDLSVAGLRKGLAGERSGLFMEQIRIIKEMRERDRANGRTGVDVRCRYGIWENVPGALSSPGKGHSGEDFAAVIEEFIRVAEPQAPSVPVPEKGWPTAGCYFDEMGNWSVAWRVMDSQYWGVPQRRRRICLVADFNGLNAPKIVFGETEHHRSTKRTGGDSSVGDIGDEPRSEVQPVTEGLSWNSDKSEPPRQETAGDVRESFVGASKAIGFPLGFRPENVRCYDETATTLCNGTRPGFTTGVIQEQTTVYGISPYHSNCMKSDNPHSGYYEADTARSLDAMNCGYPACNQGGMAVVQPVAQPIGCDVYNYAVTGDTACTLNSNSCITSSRVGPTVLQPVVDQHILDDQGGSQISVRDDGKSPTLRAETHGHPPCVMETICIEGNGSRPIHKGDGYIESDTMYTLNTIERHGVAYSVENPLCIEMTSTKNTIIEDGICPTLTARMGTGGNQVNAVLEKTYQNVTGPLMANSHPGSYTGQDAFSDMLVAGVDCRNATEYPEVNATLQSDAAHNLNSNNVVRVKHIVRRLTPGECELLQGFPRGWTDIGEWIDTNGKKHKEADSPRYKALGNSIALPPWKWVLKRLCACYERDATMASLFDGISGFPLIWTQLNGWGSVKWTSEIEEFPIAVCKRHFGDEETGEEGDFYEAIRGRCRQENV